MRKNEQTLQAKVEELEKAEILAALRESIWVKSKAARALGITERMVAYKIKKYKLEKEVHDQTTRLKAKKYMNNDLEHDKDKNNSKEDVNR